MKSRNHSEELLQDLADSLQVPPSRYEAAERSYKSVGEWLNRDTSRLRDASPNVYIQGSFRLGTAIRPISADEDYDVDLVCELRLKKSDITQAELKRLLGLELKAYADSQSMRAPEEGRRCWTQHYADGAQFHMDTLPAIHDGAYNKTLLEAQGHAATWSDSAIAITDRDHNKFNLVTEDWPHSNPKGYARWFRSRMRVVFEARRQAMALKARSKVEDIPKHKVRTPLQYTIQILKHHRDVMFVGRPDDKPISIILTTLAAHAYGQETTILEAVHNILHRMDNFIESRSGEAWIENPTDPAENFADRWKTHPERKNAFYEWLYQARIDFENAAKSSNRASAIAALEPAMGKRLIEQASQARHSLTSKKPFGKTSRFISRLNPAHRKSPPWNVENQGKVYIEQAVVKRNGFRMNSLYNDAAPLPKHCRLTFQADTDIPKPFKVFWQVVNTGPEAEAANGLRGRFDEGTISTGKLTRDESTLYSGTHSIECFIVKNGLLAAQSGQFIVNIK